MDASMPSWIWHTYVYVPGTAPASEIVHLLRMSVLDAPMRWVSWRGPINPESDTVSVGPGGEVTSETPLPPPNSISSGGPPLQLKAGGPNGTSIEPSSQYAIMSVPRSPGKVTVCGSLGDFGVKTSLSPGLASRLRGKYSRSATFPSGLEMPAVTWRVFDPSLFWVTASWF